MEYKNTLNLPKTDFPMKADLPNREPQIVKRWQETNLYGAIRAASKGKKHFILHDGPPYANGSIHMGHALNKFLKDIVIRYKTLRGYDAPYVPGWDCHGLPVEHQLFKELKMTKYDIDQVTFRTKAHEYAMKHVGIQREEFKRLGILGDWEAPYLTLARGYEAEIVRSFGHLVKNGFVYKDLKPVNWCVSCETALAEAEVEYEDKVSPSIYVKFELSGARGALAACHGPLFFVIWTTTPWTLLANVAIAVHPRLDYAVIKVNDGAFAGEQFVILRDLATRFAQANGIKDYAVVKTVKGSELEELEARHPFIDRLSKVVLAEYVSIEDGTGCVHTAPGHGQDDYHTGKRYNLPTIMPVEPKGRFDATCGEFSGMKVYDANKPIIEKLQTAKALVGQSTITHSYPHCWRCRKPIIFRATEQYFLRIDHEGLRKEMLGVIDGRVRWVPPIGKARIGAMVENRPDWCLSRQRYWGVPITAFHCAKCKALLLDAGVIAHIADLVEREGVDVWFVRPAKELLPTGTTCAGCGATEFVKENDILDVWFDSGVSHQAVLKRNAALAYPADLYLEGSDQHRGWFQSALITAMAIDRSVPFKEVLTHGFVVDGQGKKMSKSLGNVITPAEVMKRYGADILRLWVASSDYAEDVRLSEEILTRLADAYRKIRNTYKYLLSNLYDFDPAKDRVASAALLEPDRWILSRLSALIRDAAIHYDAYAFHKVFRDVYGFCVNEISSVYLDILKDRMYTARADSPERRSGQTAMAAILEALLTITSPILAMTTDEAWGHFALPGKAASVHLAAWPDGYGAEWADEKLDAKWALLIRVREAVLKKVEEKRQANEIGSSLEAAVILSSDDPAYRAVLGENSAFLRYLFIASQVVLRDTVHAPVAADAGIPVAITVEKAKGVKCQRCWSYSEQVGVDERHPTLCERCVAAVR